LKKKFGQLTKKIVHYAKWVLRATGRKLIGLSLQAGPKNIAVEHKYFNGFFNGFYSQGWA